MLKLVLKFLNGGTAILIFFCNFFQFKFDSFENCFILRPTPPQSAAPPPPSHLTPQPATHGPAPKV